jgi:antitoxin (DNA-binding transcriptional repressor) of toxin-antitoxin stability system
MKSVTTHEAKTQLSRLLAEVEAGEEIVIRRGDTPVARLVAFKGRVKRTRPRVGTVTSGPVKWTADTFAPLGQDELERWGI